MPCSLDHARENWKRDATGKETNFDFNFIILDAHFKLSRVKFLLVLLASQLITFHKTH